MLSSQRRYSLFECVLYANAGSEATRGGCLGEHLREPLRTLRSDGVCFPCDDLVGVGDAGFGSSLSSASPASRPSPLQKRANGRPVRRRSADDRSSSRKSLSLSAIRAARTRPSWSSA